MKSLFALSLAAVLVFETAALADVKPEINATDTPATLLAKAVGQKTEIVLKSGQRIIGKVESANDKSVHLSNLVGQEFYDAVILTAEISAVVVRER